MLLSALFAFIKIMLIKIQGPDDGRGDNSAVIAGVLVAVLVVVAVIVFVVIFKR